MKNAILASVFLTVPLIAYAAQIRWSEVKVEAGMEGGQGACHIYWQNDPKSLCFAFEVFCDFVSEPMGQNWRMTPTAVDSPNGLIMYRADVGSVVNHEAAQNATHFVNAQAGTVNYFQAKEPWTPLTGSVPNDWYHEEEIYLAIAYVDGTGDEMLGWLQLFVYGTETGGNVLGWTSAIDLDGGPMIVGGGAWEDSTPEPTSGLLLFFGAALLTLRRRRENGKMVAA